MLATVNCLGYSIFILFGTKYALNHFISKVFVHSTDSLFFSRTVKRFSDQIRRPVDIDVNIIDRMRTKMKKK